MRLQMVQLPESVHGVLADVLVVLGARDVLQKPCAQTKFSGPLNRRCRHSANALKVSVGIPASSPILGRCDHGSGAVLVLFNSISHEILSINASYLGEIFLIP